MLQSSSTIRKSVRDDTDLKINNRLEDFVGD